MNKIDPKMPPVETPTPPTESMAITASGVEIEVGVRRYRGGVDDVQLGVRGGDMDNQGVDESVKRLGKAT